MNIIRPGHRELAPIEKQYRTPIAAKKTAILQTAEAIAPKAQRDALLQAWLERIRDSAPDVRNLFGKFLYPSDTTTPAPDLASPAVLIAAFGIQHWHSAYSRLLDECARGRPDGLAPAERAERIREFEAELFDLEVAEELAICALEAKTGAHVLRRPDVAPAAIVAAWERAAA